jgi:hypothetical protein
MVMERPFYKTAVANVSAEFHRGTSYSVILLSSPEMQKLHSARETGAVRVHRNAKRRRQQHSLARPTKNASVFVCVI